MKNNTLLIKNISDIDRMIAKLDRQDEQQQPKLTAKEEYWQGQARKLAMSEKMDIAVVHGGWVGPKSIADKWGHEVTYVAKYIGGSE